LFSFINDIIDRLGDFLKNKIMLNKVKIAWYGKHFGEEPPLTGTALQGAGTIFFTGCNLHCIFCQNWQISQNDVGKEYSVEELADIMLNLQKQGAVNIDLVTPMPWLREIKAAIILAKQKGLKIPVAWNSNGYESVAAIREVEGLVDIYLPDFKYGDDEAADKYSRAPKYSEVADRAIREMHRQVGLLQVGDDGLAKRGIIIRHMMLPNNLSNTFSVLEKIAAIDKNIHLSLMSQYYPVYHAAEFPELTRQITIEEFAAAEDKKFVFGLETGWTQELEVGEVFLPDFSHDNPFA
jgi:putative pyruvate formate lyase activating enzyme